MKRQDFNQLNNNTAETIIRHMKISKYSRWAAALASLLILSTPISAAVPDQAIAGERLAALRERMKEMAEQLNLTEQQKEALRPVIKAEWAAIKALRDNPRLTRAQKFLRLKRINQAVIARVKSILTPSQFELWLKLREENKENLRERINRP